MSVHIPCASFVATRRGFLPSRFSRTSTVPLTFCRRVAMRLGRYAADGEEREHVAHGHMPAWAQDDPRAYWQAADEHERANGRLYSEI